MRTLSTCCLLVSGFLTEITQQIHSLRASGVISSHFVRAAGSETRALRKSAGTLWTTLAESFFVMALLYTRFLTAGEASAWIGVRQSALYSSGFQAGEKGRNVSGGFIDRNGFHQWLNCQADIARMDNKIRIIFGSFS
jgi:hypothetical protein